MSPKTAAAAAAVAIDIQDAGVTKVVGEQQEWLSSSSDISAPYGQRGKRYKKKKCRKRGHGKARVIVKEPA